MMLFIGTKKTVSGPLMYRFRTHSNVLQDDEDDDDGGEEDIDDEDVIYQPEYDGMYSTT